MPKRQKIDQDLFSYICDVFSRSHLTSESEVENLIYTNKPVVVISMLKNLYAQEIIPIRPITLDMIGAIYVVSCCVDNCYTIFELERIRILLEKQYGVNNEYETIEYIQLFLQRFNQTKFELRKIRRLDNGTRTHVWLCQDILSRRMFAVKDHPYEQLCIPSSDAVVELFTHWKLKKCNENGSELIVKMQGFLFGTMENTTQLAIRMVFKFHPLSVNDLPCPLPATILISMCRDLFLAISFLHSHGVAHRDIKPENVCIDSMTGQLLLIDFNSASSTHSSKRTTVPITTIYARPPETCRIDMNHTQEKHEYDSFKIDIWSSACLCMNLLLKTSAIMSQRFHKYSYPHLFMVYTNHKSSDVLHMTEQWIGLLKRGNIPSTPDFLSNDNIVAAYQIFHSLSKTDPCTQKLCSLLKDIFIAITPAERPSATDIILRIQ